MPKTLAGFLLVSGVLMFVFSLLRGRFEFKDIKIPTVGTGGRWALRVLGVVFMITSGALFWRSPPIPLAPPQKNAYQAVQEWLYLLDHGQYDEAWTKSAEIGLKAHTTKSDFAKLLDSSLGPLGHVVGRQLTATLASSELVDGKKRVFERHMFRVTFSSGQERTEVVTAVVERGAWKVSDYSIGSVPE